MSSYAPLSRFCVMRRVGELTLDDCECLVLLAIAHIRGDEAPAQARVVPSWRVGLNAPLHPDLRFPLAPSVLKYLGDTEVLIRRRGVMGEDRNQLVDVAALQEVYDKRVTLMPGAEILVNTMKANGATCALVSGGFDFFAAKIKDRLGFDDFQANRLDVAGGKLTGRVMEPILGREAKLAALEGYKKKIGLTRALTMATGDGANDLAMIKAAGLGVAFRAKPLVAAEADAAITHGDLTALLYLQGYTKDEFKGV